MRHPTLIVTCLLVMLTPAPPARADAPTAIDHLVAAAQIVHADAVEIRRMLDTRAANLIAVLQQVEVLRARASALVAALDAPGLADAARTPAQAAALDRARAAAGVMQALIDSKARILAEVDTAAAHRRRLRDKAAGVASRAALVDAEAAQLRD
jgi:hypothetical protein